MVYSAYCDARNRKSYQSVKEQEGAKRRTLSNVKANEEPTKLFTYPLTILDIPEGAKSLTGVPEIFIGNGEDCESVLLYPCIPTSEQNHLMYKIIFFNILSTYLPKC